MRNRLLARVTSFYLDSGDFNGIPLRELNREFGPPTVREAISELIRVGLLTVVFGDRHPNPHIRALPDHLSSEQQIAKLDASESAQACVYPLPLHLQNAVDRAKYADRPFTLALALGEPQLVHRAFELSVLENYRNDPRYHYSTDGVQGTMSVRGDYLENGVMRRSDKVFLQSFGYCFDENFNRYLAVLLCYLAKLSPEHQQIWHAREIDSRTSLHPDYFAMSMGAWPERVPIFEAFLAEMRLINQMAIAMGRPQFFRTDFHNVERPRDFSFLIRPTARESHNFVHVLDRMLSDNINREFFMNEVPYEDEIVCGPGRIEVRQRGTILILVEWLKAKFRTDDTQPIAEMIKTFRDIRRGRQRPAHAIDADQFDQRFVHEQRRLIIRAYDAVRTMRLVLENDPMTAGIEVDDFLREGKIRDF